MNIISLKSLMEVNIIGHQSPVTVFVIECIGQHSRVHIYHLYLPAIMHVCRYSKLFFPIHRSTSERALQLL